MRAGSPGALPAVDFFRRRPRRFQPVSATSASNDNLSGKCRYTARWLTPASRASSRRLIDSTPSASSRSSAAFTSASGKFPWRKVSRFGADFAAIAQSPTDFAAIYQPLTAKRSFPYMSPLETIELHALNDRRFFMTDSALDRPDAA